MLCALFFAHILQSNIDLIRTIEFQILTHMLQFFQIPSFYRLDFLFVGSIGAPARLTIPAHTQTLILLFFPVIAVTSRTNLMRRIKILSFGLLCFFVFIVSQFLTIVTLLALHIAQPLVTFMAVNVFLTIILGVLTIELMLFSIIMIPKRTKINPIIKRSYVKEYAYLIIMLTSSFSFIYFILTQVGLTIVSPLVGPIALHFSITSLVFLSYFVAYLFYERKTPAWLNCIRSPNGKVITDMVASFLVPAYNELVHIAKCIESIDKAASKYPGKTEIIIINDGSADDTAKIAADSIRNLKYSTGKLFNIPNSGKGFALNYGLQKTSGDVVFRIDADSIIDENAIIPIMRHFMDPHVGVVSGLIWVPEPETIWQKFWNIPFVTFFFIVKRAQQLVDSILVQSGAYSVFRRDALIKAGGWAVNLFGEDGEVTNRMARFGYRLEFEPDSFIYSDAPKTLLDLMRQQARWSVAYYQARGVNLRHVRELWHPRSIVFSLAILMHGAGLVHSLVWPYLAASIINENVHFTLHNIPPLFGIPVVKLAVVIVIIDMLQWAMFVYYLNKYKMLKYLKYYPVLRVVGIILTMLVRPLAVEALLHWSSKWNEYNNESFEDLRNEVRKNSDPRY